MSFLWVLNLILFKLIRFFKNELGCPRAIHNLTPPQLAIFWGDVHDVHLKKSDVHVQSVSLKCFFFL